MVRMKMYVDGFDGEDSYEPDDTIKVDATQAKRILLRGMGHMVDGAGKKVPLKKAAASLRVNDDDIKRIATGDTLQILTKEKNHAAH